MKLEFQLEFLKSKIKLYRKKLGISQEELADKANVDRRVIQRAETTGETTLINYCKIVNALGLCVDIVNIEN